MATDRVCAECGGDRWKAREFDRLRDRNYQLSRDVEKLARENGLLTYKLKAADSVLTERVAGLQRKIKRQARAILRMEKRLRERGEKPHAGASLEDNVVAVEYDVGGEA